jgi:hypothetical protein
VSVLWYHWRIIRVEQLHGAEAISKKRVTLIANDRTGKLTEKISEKLGLKIRVLFPEVQEELVAFSEEELEQTIKSVRDASAPNVLIIVLGNKITVIPYEEK